MWTLCNLSTFTLLLLADLREMWTLCNLSTFT
jgi:hypothetical protein